ncbi:hypothetical protein HKX48_004364 [Thoreauomyces humboldtii]|nr:hypothetical protein HKX48_004364 [Thoreauomyces humboldtii]
MFISRLTRLLFTVPALLAVAEASPLATQADVPLNRIFDETTIGSWAGVNQYYLAALAAQNETAFQNTLDRIQDAGFLVIRSFFQPSVYDCAKTDRVAKLTDVEDPIGTYNLPVLYQYDHVLNEIRKRGMKVIMSLHNANNMGASPCDRYCELAGGPYKQDGILGRGQAWVTNFYANSTISGMFKKRLSFILSTPMPLLGTTLGAAEDVILAFDVQNEPMVMLETSDPLLNGPWLCNMATHIKSLVISTNILVSTGAIGGSFNGNIQPSALTCPAVDVIAIHG